MAAGRLGFRSMGRSGNEEGKAALGGGVGRRERTNGTGGE